MMKTWIVLSLGLAGCASKAAPVGVAAVDAAPLVAAADATPAPAPAIEAPATFEVVFPGAGAGAPSAELVVRVLTDYPDNAQGYRSMSVHASGTPAHAEALVKDSARETVRLRVDATGVQRLVVDGVPVFVPARAGDSWVLTTLPGRGGWELRSGRQVDLAGKSPARCRDYLFECGAGFTGWSVVKSDTSTCKQDLVRCVPAPRVRVRGASTGVVRASSNWAFGDGEEIADPAAWHAFDLDESFTQPWISVGDAYAYLAMGPGESWEASLAADGSIEATILPQ